MLISSTVGVVVPEKIVSPASSEDAGGCVRGGGSNVKEAGRSPPPEPDLTLVVKPDEAL